MDKKKSKFKDDYSLRTLAYYQREGGIYNDLITILQRMRVGKGGRKILPPKEILNAATGAFDIYMDGCKDEETDTIIDYGFEDFVGELYGGCWGPGPLGELEEGKNELIALCVLCVLLSQYPVFNETSITQIIDIVKKEDETIFKEFEGLIRNNLEDKDALLDDLKNKLKLSEALIREKDAQLAQYSKTAAEVVLTRGDLMIARKYLNQGTGSRLNNALTLDAILEYAESLNSYERAQHIFGLLSKIARNTATDEEYEKIDAASTKLTSIQLSQTNIYNQTTAYGSNIFAGIVNSPNFPYGKTEEEVYKLIMPKIEQLLKEINQSYNGARRENKD